MIISKEFIKEDRNHTKYFAVTEKCASCAGTGHIPEYDMIDNGVCYTCGGSGVRHYTDKEYTPEYAKKLEDRQFRRQSQKQALRNTEIKMNVDMYLSGEKKIPFGRYNGMTINDIALDHYDYLCWMAGYTTDQALAEAVGQIIKETEDEREAKEKAKQEKLAFVGQEKEKIEMQVTLQKRFSYESRYGNVNIYKFETEDKNILLWKTSVYLDRSFDIGDKLTIKATIKEHVEYEGEKQTHLIRVKII